MNIAASIQGITNEIVIKIARHIKQETGQENLCLAGGVALNCVTSRGCRRQLGSSIGSKLPYA